MSIVVTLTLKAKPERFSELEAGIAAALPATSAAKGAELIRGASDPERHIVTVFQIWDSLENRNAYIDWRNSRGEIDSLGEFLREPLEFRVQKLIF